MVKCPLCNTMVRKSYLPQHLYKEQENRGILDFAAQAKLLVEENMMNYFFQMMNATQLQQHAAAAEPMQSSEELNIMNSSTSPLTSVPLDPEAQPLVVGLSTSNPPDREQPISSQRKTKPTKRTRELSVAGRDPKQRRLDTMFQ